MPKQSPKKNPTLYIEAMLSPDSSHIVETRNLMNLGQINNKDMPQDVSRY